MKLKVFKCLTLSFAIFIANPAFADNLEFKGDYTFAWSGIRLGKLHLEVDQGDKDYEIQSRLKTSGLMALFSSHKSLTKVTGHSGHHHFQPVYYRSDYHSGGKDKVIDLKYNEKGELVHEEVLPSRGARPEVPEELKLGAADSLTAVVAMRGEIIKALAEGRDEMIVPVYDGSRRFDLHATLLDKNTSIKLDDKMIPAIKLGLRREPIAGFKDKELKRMAEGEPLLEFFMEKEHTTLLGFQLSVYGGTFTAWVKDSCINDACKTDTQQVAAK